MSAVGVSPQSDIQIARHRSAKARAGASDPVWVPMAVRLLGPEMRLLDYGCVGYDALSHASLLRREV